MSSVPWCPEEAAQRPLNMALVPSPPLLHMLTLYLLRGGPLSPTLNGAGPGTRFNWYNIMRWDTDSL